jgi:putative ABC transport system permease protein
MFKIALRNIFRNRRRTFLTGLSIAVAVMIVIYLWSLIMGVIEDMTDNFIKSSTGHVRILNREYLRREAMLPLEANVADYQALEQIIKADKDVTVQTGRIKFGVLLNYQGGNKPIMGIGIDPSKEEKVFGLSQKIVSGRPIVWGAEEMNIGDKLARELNVNVGDTLTILTQTAYGSIAAMNLKIVGVFRYGAASIDNRTFYMPLDKAQRLLDLEGRVTEIFILVKNMDKAPEVAARLKAKINQKFPGKYVAKPWQDNGLLYYISMLVKYIYGFIYAVILILASFTILNTMFMSVLERTREIGMMKALGMKNGQIVRMILLEAMLVGILAAGVGAVLGAGMAYYLSTVGLDFTPVFEKMGGSFNFPLSYIYRGVFRWRYIFTGFGFGILFAVLAAIPPALRAAKMEPTEALHEI